VAKNLKVVFKSEIRGIAKAGDVKMVSPGYARNYLFPRRLAFAATDAAIRQWDTVRQGTIAKTERQSSSAQELAQKIEAASVSVAVKAGADGRLFGSVGRQDIAAELARQGLKVEKHAVALPQPIKQVGTSIVIVQLGAGIQAKLNVTVTAETK
jgi:large subunit ribosomal protein L9